MSSVGNIRRPVGPCLSARQRGSALIEYTVVVLLLVTVLLSNPNVIRELADALRDAYTSFVYALSIAWI